jgi:hypothetical protein
VSAARRVLILKVGNDATGELSALVASLAAQGASVVVRQCEGDYDPLLDDIVAAETVVFWK